MRSKIRWAVAVVLAAVSGSAVAAEGDGWELPFGIAAQFNSTFSVGAALRMQEPAAELIGKSNLDPGLCPDHCITTQPGAGLTATQVEAINAPGAFGVNYDNGNLNYEQHEVIGAAAKLTTDLLVERGNLSFIARGLFLYDAVNTGFDERHPNTTLQPATTRRPDATEEQLARQATLLDAYFAGSFELAGRAVNWKLGQHTLNWGESSLVNFHTLNFINPPDATRVFTPGFDLKELLIPQPMASFGSQLSEALSIEAFYQLRWRGLIAPPPGSFYSTSDLPIGNALDRTTANQSYGRFPEDPQQQDRGSRGQSEPTATLLSLVSQSSFTIRQAPDDEPRDSGQFGVALHYFADWLNNTDLGFYYANYHSRSPIVSAVAGVESCARGPTPDSPDSLLNCQFPAQDEHPEGTDLLPTDTARIYLEYPEDIQLFGLSFNGNLGDWAIQGELAYRPNEPVQLVIPDVLAAANRNAFPRERIVIGVEGIAALATIPGSDDAAPSVTARRRGIADSTRYGDVIHGYERMKHLNVALSGTYIGGPSNAFGSDSFLLLLEAGITHLPDYDPPAIRQGEEPAEAIYLEAPGSYTPLFPGQLETQDRFVQFPRQQTTVATQTSWGYRLLLTNTYQTGVAELSLLPTLMFSHDVQGTSPGAIDNYLEGRKQILFNGGLRYRQYRFDLGYLWFTGAGARNPMRDRDTLSLSAKVDF